MSETRLVWMKVVPPGAEAARRAIIASAINNVETNFKDTLGVIIGFIPMSRARPRSVAHLNSNGVVTFATDSDSALARESCSQRVERYE